MSGLGRLVIGYDQRDTANRVLHGADIDGGRCVSCGRGVFFNPTAISALGDRDAFPVCFGCRGRYSDELLAAL